jgi:alpha-tubulin suppressor-like RCC1 family protein
VHNAKLTPTEKVVQIAASGNRLFVLTDQGRVLYADSGRAAKGWTEVELPEAPSQQ